MRTWKQKLVHTATEWLALPPDALSDVSRVACLDGKEVIVENVKSLNRVAETVVEIDLGALTVTIHGRDFEVSLVTGHEVHIQGVVEQVVYTRRGGGDR